MRRIGGVPDLVRPVAERAQQIDRVGVALGQRLAVANSHHLGAAGLVIAFLGGDMGEVLRMRRVGDVDQRGAVELGLAGERVDRLRIVRGAAVMADIGDPAPVLLMHQRLIGAAPLQVAVADQPHIVRLGRSLRQSGRGGDQDQRGNETDS